MLLVLSALFESKLGGEMPLKLSSSEFKENERIPKKYTCQGDDINPPLFIEGIPQGCKTLVLIMDDPDAPAGTWVHWVLFNIFPAPKIEENSVPKGALQGKNDFQREDYGGPCPPSGTHRYFFKLYALDCALALPKGAQKKDVEKAMLGHMLGQCQLVGLFSRS
jgi:Raf kinase inhibitor-like YbhB/YbcL family protein